MQKAHRTRRLLSVALGLAIALSPAIADARAGKGASVGSRGERTHIDNGARPMERSATPVNPAQPGAQSRAPAAATQGQGFLQRNPFLGAVMGGLVGAGIGALLFGNLGHLFGGGFAGFLGLLLQLALVGGLAWLAVSFFRRRSARPAYAGGPSAESARHDRAEDPLVRRAAAAQSARGADAGSAPAEIAITPADYTVFENLLSDVQAAWSRGDAAELRRLTTPEMAGYFEEQLEADRRRGVENRAEQVKLLKGDLNEAWQEGHLQYATVTMCWSAVEYDVRAGTNDIVSGDPRQPVEATELWTLVRDPTSSWRLSAIQQTR